MNETAVHLFVAFSSLFASLILIIPFWINRKHYLISYYGFKINFFVAVESAATMFINALCYVFNTPCIVNTTIATVGACIPIALQCGRYIGLILMNKVNILKTQIITLERKNSAQINSDSGEGNLDFLNSSIKSSPSLKSNNNINIEQDIQKKYLVPIYIIFGIIISTSFLMCLIINKDKLFEKCVNSSWILFIPILATSALFTCFYPYILIYAFKNLSKDKKLDIITFLVCSLISGSLFSLSRFKIINISNSSYFFYIIYYSNILVISIPLYNIYKVNKKSSKEDFIKLLFDKKFLMLLKEQAIQLYCVENVLFWEVHQMLMTIVFDNYSASKSEKRRNRIIQKKSSNVRLDLIPHHNRHESISKTVISDSRQTISNERKTSFDIFSASEHESLDTINIIVEKEKNESDSISQNHLSSNTALSQFKGTKQDLYDMVVVNFINEKNITFNDDSQDSPVETHSKIDQLYNLIFKEYCKINNIKLTKKELLIDSFTVEDNIKKYFVKVYNIFINPDGISSLNISNTVLEDVKNNLKQGTFSHKIFKQVVAEVVDMMYYNLYLNSLKTLTV